VRVDLLEIVARILNNNEVLVGASSSNDDEVKSWVVSMLKEPHQQYESEHARPCGLELISGDQAELIHDAAIVIASFLMPPAHITLSGSGKFGVKCLSEVPHS
jgi:hypothetical protein